MRTRNWIFVIVTVIVLALLYYSGGGARILSNKTYLPIVIAGITPEKPMFNENMVSLIFDVDLDNGEYEVWAYLDPSPEIRYVNNFTYTAPENYLITSAMFYSYGDGIYWWFRHEDKNIEHCMNAFTYIEGGPNIRLDGKWCFTEFQTQPEGYDAYKMHSTSPIPFDVAMFTMVQIVCDTCIPGTPPNP